MCGTARGTRSHHDGPNTCQSVEPEWYDPCLTVWTTIIHTYLDLSLTWPSNEDSLDKMNVIGTEALFTTSLYQSLEVI